MRLPIIYIKVHNISHLRYTIGEEITMVSFLRSNRRRRWKMERASVHRRHVRRPRSNKFSGGDHEALPQQHARQQVWVGGYWRSDGVYVKGHYRHNAQWWPQKRAVRKTS
ncbi:MAG: hypothetical protein WEA04_01525 [Candidatus Andersenbacteria bacterium]